MSIENRNPSQASRNITELTVLRLHNNGKPWKLSEVRKIEKELETAVYFHSVYPDFLLIGDDQRMFRVQRVIGREDFASNSVGISDPLLPFMPSESTRVAELLKEETRTMAPLLELIITKQEIIAAPNDAPPNPFKLGDEVVAKSIPTSTPVQMNFYGSGEIGDKNPRRVVEFKYVEGELGGWFIALFNTRGMFRANDFERRQ